jgi:hypothetical protein
VNDFDGWLLSVVQLPITGWVLLVSTAEYPPLNAARGSIVTDVEALLPKVTDLE